MPKTKKSTAYAAQEGYVKRSRDSGMSRTTVWVPDDMKDEIKDVALLMRQGEWRLLESDEKPVLDKVSASRRGANAPT